MLIYRFKSLAPVALLFFYKLIAKKIIKKIHKRRFIEITSATSVSSASIE